MRQLSEKELGEAPRLVQFIHMHAMFDIPMGAKLLEQGYVDHPEYFPEEVEHRRKWATIPQSAHDAYQKDMSDLWMRAYETEPAGGGGIMEWIKDTEGFNKRMEAHQKAVEAAGLGSDAEQAIYDKHYGKYMNPYRFFTAAQVSEILNVSLSAVTQRFQLGTIPSGCIASKEGRSWIVGVPRGKKLHREATSKLPGRSSKWILIDEQSLQGVGDPDSRN